MLLFILHSCAWKKKPSSYEAGIVGVSKAHVYTDNGQLAGGPAAAASNPSVCHLPLVIHCNDNACE